jgi:thiol-disulfide isomerase/thioredoxin
MSRRTATLLIAVAVAVVSTVAGAWGYRQLQASRDAEAAVDELRRLTLPDVEGRPRSLSDWRGKVLVVNFWATWCEPCREEIPALMRARRKYAANGLEVVGIALDSAGKVRVFASELQIDYPLLIGSLETIDLSRRLGNRLGALPYTVVLDRTGQVVFTRLGGVSDAQLDAALAPHLAARGEFRPISSIRWTKAVKATENRALWHRAPRGRVPAASWSSTDRT